MRDLDTSTAGIPHAKQQAIIQVAQACASLSFLGSTVIVVAYFRFKQLRTYSFQLVCLLAVCDIAVNLSFFLGSPSDGSGLCYSQGFLQRFFQVALIVWTLLIAQSLLVVSSKTRTFDGEKRMPWNHALAWGVSALLSVAPLSTGSFGKTESFFCCIDSGDSWSAGSVWRLIFLVMVLISMVAIVWAYAEVVKNLSRAQKNVFRLSLHATTNRYKEPSTKQQPQNPTTTANTSGRASSTSLSATSLPKTSGEARLALPSLDQPSTTRGLVAGGQEASSEPRRRSRRDSLWRRIILGSIMEGNESAASLDCSRRQGVVEKYSASLDCSRRQDIVENSGQSSVSSVSYTRSNSNISVKDWLWSTSRDMGFFDDVESLEQSSEEEEECKNVLWLNGMASPAKRQLSSALSLSENSAPTVTTPEPLPTLQETRRGSSSVEGQAVIVTEVLGESDGAVDENFDSSMRTPTMKWKNLFPNARTIDEAEAAARAAALEQASLPLPLPAVEHAAAAAIPSHGGGDEGSPGSSLALNRAGSHIEDPLVAATTARSETSENNLAGPAIATPQRLIKSRFVSGVDRARGFVRRMSSLDMDHGSSGYGNGVDVRGSRYDPADKDRSGRGKMVPGQAVSGAATPMGAQEQHLPTKTEKDMDRFISRIKWYPVIYLLTWMVPLINGIYTIAVGQSNASFSLVLVATVTSRLQGLLNFICYGLNDKLKQAWLQDFMYRRAVASCCRALWCCCFGPCYRREGGKDDGGDLAADRTRETDNAAKGSSVLNSFTDIDLADEMEKGTTTTVVPVLPPLVSETPPRAPGKSMAALYATPHHSVRQGRSSLAPARPARPDRRPSATRHSSRRTGVVGSGSRRKRSGKMTRTDPAATAAAGVRRQRALVGRVRTNARRNTPALESVPGDDDVTGNSIPVSSTREKTHRPDGSRKKRQNYRRVERANGVSRKRSSGGPVGARAGAVLSPALPIAISMPVLTTAAVSGRRTTDAAGATGQTPPRSRQKDGKSGTEIRYLGDDETFSSSDSSKDLDKSVGAPRRRDARRPKP